MAATKLILLSLFLALVFTHVRADVSVGGENEVDGSVASDSSTHKIEFDELKSKIQALESQVEEKTKELKGKNDLIAEKEKIIQEKSDSISSLHDEVASLQKKGTVDAEEQVGKAYARAGGKTEKGSGNTKKEKEALNAKAIEVEKKFNELSSTIQNLQKVNEEQKSKIRKIERALKVAEEEMVKAKYEATAKIKELTEVHGAWLPPWLAVHLIQCQSVAETHWKLHGKPTLELVIQKKVIPSIKEQWLVIRSSAEPHLQLLSSKTIEVYEISKSTLAPHVLKAQEFVDPYFQEAKKHSKPYIDQVATVAKPHVEKAHEVLKPYTKKAVLAYGKFLQSATTYHHQVNLCSTEGFFVAIVSVKSLCQLSPLFVKKVLAYFITLRK
ncbi:hypothetical protein G4B88_030452 [Cannabis sativa]|uniref:Uncharacterized protein n=1 Tax=Cannabis sativa TaxID=3483 RepID=A0A7J6F6E5_CANSA|nr:hypothetical protein G4B88_030452 [Cannabis sativa]